MLGGSFIIMQRKSTAPGRYIHLALVTCASSPSRFVGGGISGRNDLNSYGS